MSQHRDPLISVYISLLLRSTSPHTRFSRAASPAAPRDRAQLAVRVGQRSRPGAGRVRAQAIASAARRYPTGESG